MDFKIDINKYMERFKVIQSPRIFDLYDEATLIKQGICPICECNLKVSQKGDIYCNSVKHKKITKKRFFITQSGFEKFIVK